MKAPRPAAGPASEPRSEAVGARFVQRRANRAVLWGIAALCGLGLCADFIASDRPLLLRLDGELFVLPNLTDPPGLRRYNNRLLRAAMDEQDWAIFPPVPFGASTHDLSAVLMPPSGDHLLGTDSEGRDVFARLVHGTRVSLAVGGLAVCVLFVVGVTVGGLAGYFGGLLDLVLMRILEVVHTLPVMLLLLTLLSIILPSGVGAVLSMMGVIGLVGWPEVARLVRAEILRVRTLPYVQAARALGFSHPRILGRHILPNALGPATVAATFAMAGAVLLEGALSFLGCGIPPDMASWGALLSDGRQHTDAWWLSVFPGTALFLTVTLYNLAGEGLRNAIDPHGSR